MHWVYLNAPTIGFYNSLLVGIFSVYLGIQSQRRRKRGMTGNVLTGPELGIGMALLLTGVFILGVHAVYKWG